MYTQSTAVDPHSGKSGQEQPNLELVRLASAIALWAAFAKGFECCDLDGAEDARTIGQGSPR